MIFKIPQKILLTLGTAAGTIGLVPAAQAQDQGSQQEQSEIIVTARRSSETLQQVPVAVTAISAAALQRYAATNLDKIVQEAPQVSLARGFSGSGASITIRGVGSSTGDPGVEQTVSVNIDGVQIGCGRVAVAALFDLQQVEILKGPQALFFGKNSPAGVISLTSADPGTIWSGYARAGYEFEAKERYVEGAVGGPLSDTLGIRLAGRFSDMDGYLRNVAQPMPNPAPAFAAYPYPGPSHKTLPDATSVTGRLTIVWQPTADFDATFKSIYDYYQDHDFSGAAQSFCAPGVNSTAGGFIDTADDCVFNDTVSSGDAPAAYVVGFPRAKGTSAYADNRTSLTSLTMNYNLGDIRVTSVSGYLWLRNKGFNNSGTSGISTIFNGSPDEKARSFTQEIRISSDFDSPVNFVFGGFYEHQTRSNGSALRGGNFLPDTTTGLFLNYERRAKMRANTYSAFGQLRWKIVPQVELAGGVRYTHDKRHNQLWNGFVDSNFSTFGYRPANDRLLAKMVDNNWSPEITLTWLPSSDLTAYAAFKTGYKSGGFSQPAVTQALTAADITFDSETASGGEIGLKWRHPGLGLRTEFNIYQYTFSNLQVASVDVSTNSTNIRNAAKARSKGVELSVDWQATENLALRAAGGYNEARYLSFPTAPCYARQTTGCSATTPRVQDLAGAPLLRAPDWSINFGSSYTQPVDDNLVAGLTMDAIYSSSYSTHDTNDPYGYQPTFWRINASVRIANEDNGWELALIGRNLTNERYMMATINRPGGTPGEYVGVTPRTREISLQATVRF